jgi:hypothetical protein
MKESCKNIKHLESYHSPLGPGTPENYSTHVTKILFYTIGLLFLNAIFRNSNDLLFFFKYVNEANPL